MEEHGYINIIPLKEGVNNTTVSFSKLLSWGPFLLTVLGSMPSVRFTGKLSGNKFSGFWSGNYWFPPFLFLIPFTHYLSACELYHDRQQKWHVSKFPPSNLPSPPFSGWNEVFLEAFPISPLTYFWPRCIIVHICQIYGTLISHPWPRII